MREIKSEGNKAKAKRKVKVKRMVKVKRNKVEAKLNSYSSYVNFKKKLADGIYRALMACFNTVGPVWNFFCIKTPNGDQEESPKVPIGTQSQGFTLQKLRVKILRYILEILPKKSA